MDPTDLHPEGLASLDVPQRLPPPPRVAVRRPGRRGLLGHVPLALWLLCVAGVGLLLLALWLAASSWAVRLFGMTVPGEVTGRADGARGAREGRVRFTYHVKEEEYSAEDAVDEGALEGLHAGMPVKVRVLPGWPRHPLLVEPAGRSGRGGGFYLGLALLGNAALGAFLRLYLRDPLRRRALVREGVATRGVVVSKETGGGRRPSWAVQYCYRAPRYGAAHASGGANEGRPAVAEKEWQVRMAVRPADFELAQVGAPLTILYDPRQPSRSVIYAFAEYETPAGGAT
jgi:hypothetical protein